MVCVCSMCVYVHIVCMCVHMFTSVWMRACPSLGLCVEVRGQPFVSVLAFYLVFFFKRWQSRKGLGPSWDSLVFLPLFKHNGITVGYYTSAYLSFGNMKSRFHSNNIIHRTMFSTIQYTFGHIWIFIASATICAFNNLLWPSLTLLGKTFLEDTCFKLARLCRFTDIFDFRSFHFSHKRAFWLTTHPQPLASSNVHWAHC